MKEQSNPPQRKHHCLALMPGRINCWIIQGDPCPFDDKTQCQYYTKYVLPSLKHHPHPLHAQDVPIESYNSLGEDNGR